MHELIIYTDGAYSQSRNRGGYAFILYKDDKFTHKYLRGINNSSNQRAEMLAVISAFRYLLNLDKIPNTLIITDSMYIIGTTIKNWSMNANKDLWSVYFALYDKVKEFVTFKHVRGHQGDVGNNLADLCAVVASQGIEYGS